MLNAYADDMTRNLLRNIRPVHVKREAGNETDSRALRVAQQHLPARHRHHLKFPKLDEDLRDQRALYLGSLTGVHPLSACPGGHQAEETSSGAKVKHDTTTFLDDESDNEMVWGDGTISLLVRLDWLER